MILSLEARGHIGQAAAEPGPCDIRQVRGVFEGAGEDRAGRSIDLEDERRAVLLADGQAELVRLSGLQIDRGTLAER